MCNPIDAVNNLLDALHAQLIHQIDLAIDFYGADESTFYEPLTKPDWVVQQPYASMTFEHEWFEGGFHHMCSAFELFFGSPAENDFAKELCNQVREHVEQRLALRVEKDMQIAALEWKWRREREIEQGEAV